MKHQEFNGYPTEFSYLCKEGGHDMFPRVYSVQREQIDDFRRFYNDLENHGYDIYSPSDGFPYNKALSDLNEVIRREAINHKRESYDKIIKAEEVCRCGKWVFLRNHPYFSDKEEDVPLKKGRGGRREGSGRKSNNQKLVLSNTVNIRVPEIFKDFLKNMSDLLILKAEEGINIKQVLSEASWQLNQAAENYRTADYTSEVTERWARDCDQGEKILNEIYKIIPYFSLKDPEE